MPFDQATRNRLSRFVTDARALLTEEFTRQLQQDYGLDPSTGDVTDIEKLSYLDDARRETAKLLRATLDHYLAGTNATAKARQEALIRIVREQAFTVLNRLCALRMAEARELLIQSVAGTYNSRGFQLYARLAGTALGEIGDAYRCYIFSVFDELAVDLPVLFDRWSPQGRLFPREAPLLQLLNLINDPEIDPLWAEDETIGWIYQYFNSKEERKAMRDASQAPRNSRELAVRNQFFTPRYVVEFLTDNTLGRIWYEMTRGETGLADTCRYLVRRPNEVFLRDDEQAPAQYAATEGLSQEELLKQTVYRPHRPFKDPRDLKMLDPACGSMHFGLYAFDLFERIYEEAWEIEAAQGPTAFGREASLSLQASYPSKEAYLRDVPRLIVEQNIHGVDIDSRAVQIAGLSLWLRAQRSWHEQGLRPQDRPTIRRSNIVCAEPMPGERSMLEEFLASLRDDRLETLIRRVLNVPAGQTVRATPTMVDALANLVRTVWQEMELAGEAGSLLKIEESLTNAITQSRAEWEEKLPLFRVTEFGMTEESNDRPTVRYYRTIPGEEADFWDRAEPLVLAALKDYAEAAESSNNYQRRLFANDAARGFAFIDLCRKRYDAVLMNPPFGETSKAAQKILEAGYESAVGNLLCAFMLRGAQMCTHFGAVGSITDRTWLQKTTYEPFRESMITGPWRLRTLVDLGWGVLDEAQVATCMQTLRNAQDSQNQLVSVDLRSCADVGKETGVEHFSVNLRGNTTHLHTFALFPDKAIAHWCPKGIKALFETGKAIDPNFGISRRGISAGDTTLGFRLEWEVPPQLKGSGKRWTFLQSGGAYSPFYRDSYLVCWHEGNFAVLKPLSGARLQNLQYIGRPGLTWAKRTDFLAPTILPSGHCFTDEGSIVLTSPELLWGLLAMLNSGPLQYTIEMFCGQHKSNGYVAKLPMPELRPEVLHPLSVLAREIFEAARLNSINCEPSTLFHSAIDGLFDDNDWSGSLHEALTSRWRTEQRLSEHLSYLQELIDANAADLLDLSSDDLAFVSEFISARRKLRLSLFTDLPESEAEYALGRTHLLISYAMGCAFGRWDIRWATHGKHPTNLPDPLEPLPSCPPGMLQDDLGFPATPVDLPSDYQLRISWLGILVDDDGNPEDVERRIGEVQRVIWKGLADTIEQEANSILGVGSLRDYFRKPLGFFADHISRYTKGRRQGPIYWPLSTPSGSFTVWLYYHRVTDQTLYTCVNDFVDPKLKQLTDYTSQLRQKFGRSSADEKELERLSDLLLELQDFRAELLRLAAIWKPNLNDGVQITAAPLWKLFQHRPWRAKLKETWEKLEAGEYDWAHLAYSIWPDRVREKCRTDKSLAIAHDLEGLYIEPIVQPKKGSRAKQEGIQTPVGLFDDD